MQTEFYEVARGKLGYSKFEVRDFLENLKQSFEHGGPLSSTQLQNTRFSLEESGFETSSVDRVLDWFLDIFQLRDAQAGYNQDSAEQYAAVVSEFQELLTESMATKKGERFALVGLFETGYDPRVIDSYLLGIREYFVAGVTVDTKRLRPSMLPKSRMGYLDSEVDEFMSVAIAAINLARVLPNR